MRITSGRRVSSGSNRPATPPLPVYTRPTKPNSLNEEAPGASLSIPADGRIAAGGRTEPDFLRTLLLSKAAIFISNADGGEEHPLLKSTSLDYNPSWSPDGRWIVFTSERDGSADLYRVKPDGTALERLTDNLAYDDQQLLPPKSDWYSVFCDHPGERRCESFLDFGLHTRKATPLTSGTDGGNFRPSWSPDGKWIAFSSDRGSTLPMGKGRWEHLQIARCLIHPDGSGLKRLTEHGNFCGSQTVG